MICVNALDEARAALRDGARELVSPDYAACHAGVGYYAALLKQLRADFPDTEFTFTLCCGDDPAIAHEALRRGFSVRCDTSDAMLATLHAVAHPLKLVVGRGHRGNGRP